MDKVCVLVWYKRKDLKCFSLEEFCWIVVNENVYFFNESYEIKNLKFVDENVECWVVF